MELISKFIVRRLPNVNKDDHNFHNKETILAKCLIVEVTLLVTSNIQLHPKGVILYQCRLTL